MTPKRSSKKAGRLDDQLCFALYAATNAMTRVYRPLLQEMGITYPQYLVLLVLWEHQTCRLGEIAEQLQLATHAISPIIDRMVETGLVRRTKDADDGRVVHVELTARGTAMEASAAAVQNSVRCSTMLDPVEVQLLRAQLIALTEQLNDA